MKFLILITLLITSGLTGSIIAAESKSSEYKDINKLLAFIQTRTQSPFIKVEQQVNIKSEAISYEDIRFWISNGEERIHEIEVDKLGNVSLPLLDNEIAKTAMLSNNQQRDQVSINLSIGVDAPQQKQVPYKQLFILLDDTNTFISEMGGAAAWFAPNLDALSFEFEQPAQIIIATKKKTYKYETDDENTIEIDIRKRLMKENPTVEFSALPTSMSPVD